MNQQEKIIQAINDLKKPFQDYIESRKVDQEKRAEEEKRKEEERRKEKEERRQYREDINQ